MTNAVNKIRRYESDILNLDASGATLHIVICDCNVRDSDINFCLSQVNSKDKLQIIDIMCKHCAELLLKVPFEERRGILSDCSEDNYIFSVGDTVYSIQFNSIGTVVKNSQDSHDDLFVKFEVTDESKETELLEALAEDDGSILVYKDDLCLV